jgi:hypothetical protein
MRWNVWAYITKGALARETTKFDASITEKTITASTRLKCEGRGQQQDDRSGERAADLAMNSVCHMRWVSG